MKQLIQIILCVSLVTLSACNKGETIAPVYTSLEGNWSMNESSIKANFSVEKVNSQLVIRKGSFTTVTTGTTVFNVVRTYILSSDPSKLQLEWGDANAHVGRLIINIKSINPAFTEIVSGRVTADTPSPTEIIGTVKVQRTL